ncbi:hypothetical protein ARMGADRAFT_1168916 [Armillaria gallica]|uniref:Uncharacterized protein n=1 Tax=Armillaria gallica TaxID=47427 RepID=A0A2H3DFM8_ARMGA|nr:hypothetical protein ARMGADRAFT_1168916 [Armillaria gallica]
MSKKAAKVLKTSGSANIYDHRDVMLGKVRSRASGVNSDGYQVVDPNDALRQVLGNQTAGEKANFYLKGGKKKENVEREHDGEADEVVGTSKKGKRDKEEHDEGDVENDPEALKVRARRRKLQKTFLSIRVTRRRICWRWIDCSVQSRHTSLSPFTTSRSGGATINSVFFSILFLKFSS